MFNYDYQYLEKLVKRAEQNPENAYPELFAATYQDQYRFAQIFMNDAAQSKILLQETYIQTFANLGQLRHPSQFLYYLTQTLFKFCMECMPENTNQYRLMNFATTLSPREKQIFVMKYLQHMPNSTIATALNWSFWNVSATTFFVYRKYRTFRKKYHFSPYRSASKNPSNELAQSDAASILENILTALSLPQPNTSLKLLESWANYKKPGSPLIFGALGIATVIMLMLPLLFVQPKLSIQRIDIDSTTSAKYRIKISSFFPVVELLGTLDHQAIPLTKENASTYTCKLTANGTLSFKATALNGQFCTKELQAEQIDSECPTLIDTVYNDRDITLTVSDTFSGVDYQHISGVTINNFDSEKGTISFTSPSEDTQISIPDFAGNILTLTVHQGEIISD